MLQIFKKKEKEGPIIKQKTHRIPVGEGAENVFITDVCEQNLSIFVCWYEPCDEPISFTNLSMKYLLEKFMAPKGRRRKRHRLYFETGVKSVRIANVEIKNEEMTFDVFWNFGSDVECGAVELRMRTLPKHRVAPTTEWHLPHLPFKRSDRNFDAVRDE